MIPIILIHPLIILIPMKMMEDTMDLDKIHLSLVGLEPGLGKKMDLEEDLETKR